MITVFVVSAPFIYFMTKYAERFNLGKLEVLITTSLLGIHSLMFPSYMRKEQVLIWGLLAGGILIGPWGIASFRSRKRRNKEVASKEIKDTIEEVFASVEVEAPIEEVFASVELETPIEEVFASVEVEAPIEEVFASVEVEAPIEEVFASVELETPTEEIFAAVEVEEPVEEVFATVEIKDTIEEAAWNSDEVTHEVEEFSLEEIVEKGFQAKEEGNFHRAAEWFLCALDRKPTCDIAFYLIIESYQHWQNGYSTKEALNKVRPHINEYLKDAPLEWSMKLSAWVQKEKVTNEL